MKQVRKVELGFDLFGFFQMVNHWRLDSAFFHSLESQAPSLTLDSIFATVLQVYI